MQAKGFSQHERMPFFQSDRILDWILENQINILKD